MHNVITVKDFLEFGEQVSQGRGGIAAQSFSHPWDEVEVFLKKYITCGGRYQTVYFFEFPLLSHLRHRTVLNMPFYLFKSLHYMVGFVRSARHPLASLTHHGLVKLLILKALAQQNRTWAQFTSQPKIIRKLAQLGGVAIEEEDRELAQLGGVEVEEEDWSPSNSVGRGTLDNVRSEPK